MKPKDEDLDEDIDEHSKNKKNFIRFKKKFVKNKEKTVNLHKNIKSMFDGLDVQFQAMSEEMRR